MLTYVHTQVFHFLEWFHSEADGVEDITEEHSLDFSTEHWSDNLIQQSLISVMHLADTSELRSSNPMEMHVFPSFPCKEEA